MTKPSAHMSEAAFQLTRQMTYGHYENFPVGSWFIPPRLRPHVCNIYAFARTADDFADESQFAGERMERLQQWRHWLHHAGLAAHAHTPLDAAIFQGDTKAELIFHALTETMREFQLPVSLFNDLISAFMLDVTKPRYATFTEVLYYCRNSANPVGRLILHLFGYVNEQWMGMSDAICTALQLANFWQDVALDLQKNDGAGRIYIPQEDLRRFNVTEDDLFAHRDIPAVRELMAFQVERTRQLFVKGRGLCDIVPHPRLRWELRATWLGGMRILAKIERNRFDVFRRPRLRPADWVVLLWQAWRWRRSAGNVHQIGPVMHG